MLKNTLFFDTETTGLVLGSVSDTDPRQPMPIQLGMKLDQGDRIERFAANYMMKPEGWVMSEKASEVTGLNNDLAEQFGCHFISGVEMFLDMVENADIVVAHNASFDVTVMRRAAYVYSQMVDVDYIDPFENKPITCTMLSSMDIVKALPKRRGQWKWPRLEEAVKFFFNENLDGAHDALVDVRGCARVYYELVDMGVFSGEFEFS
jgi:DNA polymerase-3 subunit epsilon